MRYFYAVACAISILINAVLGGQPTQTMCCRAAIAREKRKRWGCIFCKIVDRFDPGHCQMALDFWFRRQTKHE